MRPEILVYEGRMQASVTSRWVNRGVRLKGMPEYKKAFGSRDERALLD